MQYKCFLLIYVWWLLISGKLPSHWSLSSLALLEPLGFGNTTQLYSWSLLSRLVSVFSHDSQRTLSLVSGLTAAWLTVRNYLFWNCHSKDRTKTAKSCVMAHAGLLSCLLLNQNISCVICYIVAVPRNCFFVLKPSYIRLLKHSSPQNLAFPVSISNSICAVKDWDSIVIESKQVLLHFHGIRFEVIIFTEPRNGHFLIILRKILDIL